MTALTSADKATRIAELGADAVVTRDEDLRERMADDSVDVVVDNVAGEQFPTLLKILAAQPIRVIWCYRGPIVSLDMRDMYLKDITLIGCTGWDEPVFPNLVRYIERGEIGPLLASVSACRHRRRAGGVHAKDSHRQLCAVTALVECPAGSASLAALTHLTDDGYEGCVKRRHHSRGFRRSAIPRHRTHRRASPRHWLVATRQNSRDVHLLKSRLNGHTRMQIAQSLFNLAQ